MLRVEFVEVVTNTGMATLKEMRRLASNKDNDEISEFQLLRYPHFDDIKLAKMIAERYRMTFIDLKNAKVSGDVISLLSKRSITKYRMIPIQKTSAKITLATFDPTVKALLTEVGETLKFPVELILTNIQSFKKLYSSAKESVDELMHTIREISNINPADENISEDDIGEDIITFVNRILAESFLKKASDIHVEPYEKVFRIRFRIDGSLHIVATPPKNFMLPVISRLKIMAQMDISEKRKPQDGRIKLLVGGSPIDYRVSSMPTLFGEKIVLRLLDQSNLQLDMTILGFEAKQIEVFKEAIHRPYGMCLVTGPTGSGKTTSLYSALSELNTPDTNISTAEDPVEFNLEGCNQVNIRKDIGLTFASALKSFLRQDPDVILVGEIRDKEVGDIAVEAALTGHLVLSTLHTNDAPATITRLLNMGIEPFLVVAALNVVVAQRLCRKICLNCRAVKQVSKEELVSCGIAASSADRIKIYHGTGCDICNGTGHKGRVAIYEVMPMTPKIRELILQDASTDNLKVQAIKEGMKTLRMSALTKVAQGLTTLEEALANSAADDVKIK